MSRRVFKLKLPPLWKNADAPADQFRFITCPKRIAVAATGTKTGKTLGCAEWVVQGAGSNPGTLWWWVAPSYYQSKIGFDRAKSLLPLDKCKINETEKFIKLANGSSIEFRTGEKPNLLYGAAVHGLVLDEAARMRESVWEACQTTMTQTMGPIRIATNTDQGKRNWVYPLYVRGLDPDDPEVASFSIRTYDNPYITPEAIATLKKNLPRVAYQALVEAEFPDDSLTVFRNISSCIKEFPPFELPKIKRYISTHQYVAGLDLAKYQDYTVLIIMDISVRPAEIVYFLRLNNRSWQAQIDAVRMPLREYNAACYVDSTGVGDPIFEQMKGLGVKVRPYVFSNQSKRFVVEKLAIGLEQGNMAIPSSLDTLIQELEAFEFEVTESGNVIFASPVERGIHDDCVIALALAWISGGIPFSVGYESARGLRMGYDGKIAEARRRWKASRGF